VHLLVFISYLKWKQLTNTRFCVILGLLSSSSSSGVRNFERYELKSESMQPAQQYSQRIVTKCQAGRNEMRRVAVLLVFVYCFLIETVRTRVCLELEGRKECQLNVLSTLTVTCFWPRGMSVVPKAICIERRALFVCPARTKRRMFVLCALYPL